MTTALRSTAAAAAADAQGGHRVSSPVGPRHSAHTRPASAGAHICNKSAGKEGRKEEEDGSLSSSLMGAAADCRGRGGVTRVDKGLAD